MVLFLYNCFTVFTKSVNVLSLLTLLIGSPPIIDIPNTYSLLKLSSISCLVCSVKGCPVLKSHIDELKQFLQWGFKSQPVHTKVVLNQCPFLETS